MKAIMLEMWWLEGAGPQDGREPVALGDPFAQIDAHPRQQLDGIAMTIGELGPDLLPIRAEDRFVVRDPMRSFRIRSTR